MSTVKENITKKFIHIYKLAKLQETRATYPYTYDKYIFLASHVRLSHSSMIPNFYQIFQKYRLNLPSQFHLLLRNVYFD